MGARHCSRGGRVLSRPLQLQLENISCIEKGFRDNNLIGVRGSLKLLLHVVFLEIEETSVSAPKNEVLTENGSLEDTRPSLSAAAVCHPEGIPFLFLKSPRSSLSYRTYKTFVLNVNI